LSFQTGWQFLDFAKRRLQSASFEWWNGFI
jgi:hypothetical protein